jgi:hypothetical protein
VLYPAMGGLLRGAWVPNDERWRTALGGVLAAGLLSAADIICNRLGLMRLDFGRMLGATLRPDSAKTRALGWAMNLVNGVAIAFAYREVFRRAGLFPGATAGLAVAVPHAIGATALIAALPYVHPRPKEAGLKKAPPLAYGPLTLPAMLLGHELYGMIVGWMAGAERRERYVSARTLAWLRRQEQVETALHTAESEPASAVPAPVQLESRRSTLESRRPRAATEADEARSAARAA